ncbi:tRNA(m(1)G37)methyltransferase [Puccinia graminis f. sp. tritici]|uniref:tRNA (guanine(37)-N1)-methyltransferase n=1 Tax=Puccinia graminis f. sp. tritici TaxID=56615 RepID=A0A5B0MGC2_PUCGR|nr:tRNA(m(1)G37)methyltransferase [Puccinia graminis f. sp. tritici]KAA1091621.1 tRNA(m(1)G37)methyltransferase [Puccinia graminis f. sp. tritici]
MLQTPQTGSLMLSSLLTTRRTISSMAALQQPSRHRFPPPNNIQRLPLRPDGQQEPVKLTEAIKQQFKQSIPLLAARVPSPSITKFKTNPEIRKALLNSKNLRSVEPDPDSTDNAFKLLLLNTPHKDQIPESTLKVFQEHDIQIKNTKLDLDWEYWMADEIIERLLPDQLTDIPASFTMIGHIAHFNLRDEYLPYKYLIGQVILEKNLAIKTVVNKIDNINSQFRFFEMELLAGEPDYTVTLWQSGCRYRFDFSKVYYNPRLSTEHDLLSSMIEKDEVVVDAFAGVGPFAMRAAANRKAWVLASDLNPASVEALETNVRLNKLQGRVAVSGGDGREKIREAVRTLWLDKPFKTPNSSPLLPDHFIINLPDSSIQFLDAFRDLYHPLSDSEGFLDAVKKKSRLPLLHCYCFTKQVDEPESDICQRVSEVMKVEISPSTVARFELKFVRAVAPHKDMYRITFELPLKLLFSSSSEESRA